MEATRFFGHRQVIWALTLSIAAALPLVNARAQSLSSVNQAKSAKTSKGEFDQLVQTLLQRGLTNKIGSNLAPVIGLEKAAEVRQQDIYVKQDELSKDVRTCFVVLSDTPTVKTPMSLFIQRSKMTPSSLESTYFKVSLTGKLERSILSKGKRADNKAVRGSGVRTEQDIRSPDVKKEFDAEMAYWLKDWLKKELKSPAKKDAASATPTAGKTATATL